MMHHEDNTQPKKASIQISYRDDQGKQMHGAFFDHYCMRRITKHDTEIVVKAGESTIRFQEFTTRSTVHTLGFGDAIGEKIVPAISNENSDHAGLLIIPGRSRDGENPSRDNFEQQLIRDALKRGRPILSICAGSWQLWKAFGGNIRDVTDHTYASMPRIVTDGSVGNNVQIHSIKLNPSIVKSAMKATSDKVRVNSVHWAAPDERNIPDFLEVSAVSTPDDKLVPPRNRQGEVMRSESGVIEAFETKYGAPVIGIQWHPEAYYQTKTHVDPAAQQHLNLIKYMVLAGDAYCAKRAMLKEFKDKWSEKLKAKIEEHHSDIKNHESNPMPAPR